MKRIPSKVSAAGDELPGYCFGFRFVEVKNNFLSEISDISFRILPFCVLQRKTLNFGRLFCKKILRKLKIMQSEEFSTEIDLESSSKNEFSSFFPSFAQILIYFGTF